MSDPTDKIIIADSQYLVVESLKILLSQDLRCVVSGVAHSGSELLRLLEKDKCTLLIIDPQLFDFEEVGDLKSLKQKYPDLVILVLTSTVGKNEFNEISKAGIKNIIYKTADKDEILTAVEAAFKHKKYYSEEIIDLIIELGERKIVAEEPTHLTNSEIEIVRLISGGLTTKEIAIRKNISFHTVNTHRKNIFRKMGVTNASELIIQAIKAGWIDNIEYFI